MRAKIACVILMTLLAVTFLNPSPTLAGDGDPTWAVRMGGGGLDTGNGLAVDSAGNSYVTGSFVDPADFGPFSLVSAGNSDIFVSKVDTNGNVVWAKRMGGSDFDQGNQIAVDASGNIYVTGSFSGTADFGNVTLTSTGGSDIFVIKLNNAGTVIWAKQMGGTYSDDGQGIAADPSGNVYVTGEFTGQATFGSITLTSPGGYYDAFVSKLNNGGNVVWAKEMGGSVSARGAAIAVDATGNSYVTGSFYNEGDFGPIHLTGVLTNGFVTKLDSSGNTIWAKRMEGQGYGVGSGIGLDTGENVYVTGTFSGLGDCGGIPLTSAGDLDIFVCKLNNSGTTIWAQRMGSTDYDQSGGNVVVDKFGNVYVTGTFQNPQDVFVVKLDSIGNVLWTKGFGYNGWNGGYGIGLDAQHNLYVAGYFSNDLAFGSTTLTSAGSEDIFLVKLGGATVTLPMIINNTALLSPIIPATTKVLAPTTTQYLSSISSDGVTFTFSQSTAQLNGLLPGQVMVGDACPSAPNGFLRKVTSLSSVGGQVIVNTTATTLAESIQQGEARLTRTFTPSDIRSAQYAKGVTLARRPRAPASGSFYLTISNVVLYDDDGDLKTTNDQIVANGNIDVEPALTFDLRVNDWKLQQLYFAVGSNQTTQLTISSTVSKDLLQAEKELAHYNLAPITLVIGPVPVVITPILTFLVGANGSVSVGVSTSVTEQNRVAGGAQYANGNWSPISQYSRQFVYDPPTFSAGLDVKGYAGPKLSLLLYDVAGPEASIEGYLEFQVNPLQQPRWILFGGLQVPVDVTIQVLSHVVAGYNATVIDVKWVIAQGSSGGTYSATLPGDPSGAQIAGTDGMLGFGMILGLFLLSEKPGWPFRRSKR